MRTLVHFAACAALALATGCGDDDTTTSPPASGALVSYARTGGVASMPESLVVSEDGSATVEAGIDPARESFQLEPDELDRLRSELEAADFEGFEQSTEPTGCADCYAYEVTYGGRTISYDQSETVPEPIAVVVAHLSEITANHYPPDAG